MSDVALYGALCALAAFDRAELSERVVKNSAFRSMLELYPEVRDVPRDTDLERCSLPPPPSRRVRAEGRVSPDHRR